MANKKLNLCGNGKISIRNDGIIAKQTPMTIQEARLLRLVIMQVSQYDDDLMEYEVTIPEIANYLGIATTQTLYDDIFNICDKLTSKKIAIKTESTKNPWSLQPWMAEASYDGSVVKLALNKRIKPYVMEFHELFTQYEMKDILQLRSYYALRIYEILKMKYTSCRKKKNTFDFTIEELREMTSTESKHNQIGHFRKKVIEIAEREINEKTDINITTEILKSSRKYIGVRFTVTEKSKLKRIEAPNPESASPADPIPGQVDLGDIYKVKELLNYKSIPCTIKQAEQLFVAYNSEISEQFLDNLDHVFKNKRIKNRVGYLITMANDHVAKESEIPIEVLEKKSNARKKKVETIEPMSESREQAYRDLEVEFAEDLWPDLPDLD